MESKEWPSIKKSAPAIEETIQMVIKKMKSTESKLSKVEPVRFYGKNYPLWAQQMELFLKKLNVAYVLYEPCPSVMLGPEGIAQSKAAIQKWMIDDSLCRTTILNHLCFSLCYTCLKKKKITTTTTAKQLWDDLKRLQSGTHATKRSLVRQYIEFRMLEKKPIVEQVQEFNRIFDSMVASGVVADEKFHVDVIISKLPKSWNDERIKLMHEKYITFTMLMDRLRVEEESRMSRSTTHKGLFPPFT